MFKEIKIDHDRSDVLFAVSTDFGITEDMAFTPALYYQSLREDSVNTEDQTFELTWPR